jgi:branched-chain amino acid transport system ATP-binding protein
VPLGIALVPEGRKLFGGMTTLDNLRVAERRGRPGQWTVETVLDAFPQLRPKISARAGDLSGGQQQAVAIGRALMTNPRLLLLDEVSLGLSPVAVEQLYASLRGPMRDGTTIVLVEQDLTRALAVADRVICMLEGRVVFEGAAAQTTRDEVLAAYFGVGR